MRILLVGAATELGAAVEAESARRGHELVEAEPEVIINVGRQTENSLLHDGWAWKGYGSRVPLQVSELLETGRRDGVRLIVDASYAFLYGEAREAREDSVLTAPGDNRRFLAALEADRELRSSGLPVCTVRLGYGYGPLYKDLKRYRNSFRLLRPYYAGPGLVAPWIHHEDAASALVIAAEKASPGDVFNVADSEPVSLRSFIDHFGRRALRRVTYHLPRWSLRFLGGQIRREQVILLDQATTVDTADFRNRFGWKPSFPSYREGLADTVADWKRRT